MEEKYFQIDRENRILLGKMSEIMKTPSYSKIRGTSGPPSLNRDARKFELERVTAENQHILKRIQKAQPIYNHIEWEECYRKNLNYVKNVCEYPPSLVKTRTRSRSALQPLSMQPVDDKRDKQLSNEPTLGEASADLKYVLKEGKQIGNAYYMVEMATDGRTLAISADDFEGQSRKTLELLINEKNTRQLLRKYNHDYSLIANMLRVDGDRLLLESPADPYEGG
jgi:hypothetical protein